MKSKQCYILLNTMDATNIYTCEMVAIYKTSCTMFPEHFEFSCHYNCKFDLGTNDATSNLKQHSAQFRVPSEYFDPLMCTISSSLTVKSLKRSQEKCEDFLAFWNNLELLTRSL